MATLVAAQTTNVALAAATETDVIGWVDITSYDETTLNFIMENTGGANPITDREIYGSNDGGLTETSISAIAADITIGEALTIEVDCSGYTSIKYTATSALGTTAQAWVVGALTTSVDAYALTTLAKVKAYLGISVTTYDALLARIINAATDSIETWCDRKFAARVYAMERHDGDRTRTVMVDNWPVISVERVAAGSVGAIQIRGTSGDAFSATVSVTRAGDPAAHTHLKLSTHAGANDGDVSLAFATYPTLALLGAQVTGTAGWSATIIGNYGKWESTELMPVPSRECLATAVTLEVPDTRLTDYRVDHDSGEIFYGGGFGCGWNNIYVDYNGGYVTIPADLEQTAIVIIADIFNSRKINRALKSEKIGDYAYAVGDVESAVADHSMELAMVFRHHLVPAGRTAVESSGLKVTGP